MATASGINKVVSYKKETSFGTLPSPTTGGQTLRRVSSTFNLTKETYQSEEIRTDYQLVDFRHGVRSVEGSISGELSAGTYADFLASALARNWTAATPSALGSTTIASVGGTYTITRTTGSWLTDAVRVGNVIRLTGFATANNGANLLVIALTATVATVVALNNVQLTPETVASGGAFVATGKTTYAPTTGHTDDSYTFEEWYSDIGQSEVMAALTLRNSELLSDIDRLQNELNLLKAEREDEKADLQALHEELEAALTAARAEEGA